MLEGLDMFFGGESVIASDPGSTLEGAKIFLAKKGYGDQELGSDQVLAKFAKAKSYARDHGTYAGKSTDFGQGGRAALMRHEMLISGKFGTSLSDIGTEEFARINAAVRANYFHQLQFQ